MYFICLQHHGISLLSVIYEYKQNQLPRLHLSSDKYKPGNIAAEFHIIAIDCGTDQGKLVT